MGCVYKIIEVGSHLPKPFTFSNGPSSQDLRIQRGTNLGAVFHVLEDLKLVCHHPSDDDLGTPTLPPVLQFLV